MYIDGGQYLFKWWRGIVYMEDFIYLYGMYVVYIYIVKWQDLFRQWKCSNYLDDAQFFRTRDASLYVNRLHVVFVQIMGGS